MAFIAAAAISGIGAIGGSLISADATGKAVKATQQGAQAALDEQGREFNIGQNNLQPWLRTGSSALGKLAQLYGLDSYSLAPPGGSNAATGTTTAGDTAALANIRSGLEAWHNALPGNSEDLIKMIDGGASLQQVSAAMNSLRATTTNPRNTAFLDPLIAQAKTASDAPQGTFTPAAQAATGTAGTASVDPNASFYQSPDYLFRLTQGLKGVDAGAAARGMLDSGATRKAEIGYAGNLASGEYSNYANRLASLAGLGQTTAQGLGTLGQNYATNVGNIQQSTADSRASSYTANGNTYANLVSGLGGQIGNLYQNRNAANNNGYATFDANTGNYNPGANGFDPRMFS